jgi:hypothetical protein
MTPEEHQERHKALHNSMDELLACYIASNPNIHGFLTMPIGAFLTWAHAMTLHPVADGEHRGTPLMLKPLVAQSDDPELLEWLANASMRGGDFIKSIANAGLRADPENYCAIRPLLLFFREKYANHEPSDAVKQEIRERSKP